MIVSACRLPAGTSRFKDVLISQAGLPGCTHGIDMETYNPP
jgi:hypothetical protein